MADQKKVVFEYLEALLQDPHQADEEKAVAEDKMEKDAATAVEPDAVNPPIAEDE